MIGQQRIAKAGNPLCVCRGEFSQIVSKIERPIQFSAPMVRAILDGTKTQTRRAIKPQPTFNQVYEWNDKRLLDSSSRQWCWKQHVFGRYPDEWMPQLANLCPYGQPGDRLWVRETWKFADWTEDGSPFVQYKADGVERLFDELQFDELHTDNWEDRLMDIWASLSTPENYSIDKTASDRKWRPSIHMPRWASRITLEITGVRIERLTDISHKDAAAEGVCHVEAAPLRNERLTVPQHIFCHLWESIYGAGSWDANPLVWVIEFKRVMQ